jgi:hypothetical protein
MPVIICHNCTQLNRTAERYLFGEKLPGQSGIDSKGGKAHSSQLHRLSLFLSPRIALGDETCTTIIKRLLGSLVRLP